ncbi:MAG: hypothetical protein HQ567_12585 [Candidatus Nealsonbacteria bacterium]|nr:hypothetical protein [Candidatus Nealsonbacteria bacterium]
MKEQLQLNRYGCVDIRAGVPETGLHLEKLPLPEAALQAAGIVSGEALVKFLPGKRNRWKPQFDGWVIERNWEQKFADHQVAVDNVLARIEEEAQRGEAQETGRDEEQQSQRSEAAKKGAETRKKNRILGQTPYGQLLLTLESAQQASGTAKSRAANGLRYRDYKRLDGSEYSRANYHRSRCARDNDYRAKAATLRQACELAQQAEIPFGWQPDPANSQVPWVVYFDLPTGQVSFHARSRGEGPEYEGQWDEVEDGSADRIQAAIREVLSD